MISLRRIDLRASRSDGRDMLPRASEDAVTEVRAAVAGILEEVRRRGQEAVRDWSAQLDGYDGHAGWEVPASEVQAAIEGLDHAFRAALEAAAERVRWFHERARPRDWAGERDGAELGVRHQPLQRVGVYVPGGQSPLVSTAIMTIVPARVAGVDEIVLCTPPGADGSVPPAVLAAAAIAGGADRIFRLGGAQAVAAMGYGTDAVPRCDKVVGPGNAYVAEAKQQLAAQGECGIDLLAGTTEVMVIADSSAEPVHVAADLVAQAEHDPQAPCVLVTPDESLVARVEEALAAEVGATKHVERVRTALEGFGAAVLVADLDHAVAVADGFAPEHLEVQTVDAPKLAERVRFAGSVFVDGTTPVSLGDYCAGPNHTLPTGGTARFTGGLSTADFLVPVNWVRYQPQGLEALAEVVEALGRAEDLPAHIRAVHARLGRPTEEPSTDPGDAEPQQ